MEKRVIIGLAACVMVLSVLSCAKEQQKEDPQEDQNGLVTEILSATKEGDATKVTMNSLRQFGWSNLDDVAFTINKGGSYEFRTSDHYGETEPGKFVVTHSGIRQGYAVMPASFQGSYDGEVLVVNYPDSYDISADVDGGCYDNADAAHFIPFPMVSKSIPESAELTFYSIGAMAKVTVSDVPAGTKNLYITFNKPVTGNFPVEFPTKTKPQVSCRGDVNTTITVKISESGLASQQTITLYIPIPVCDEGLFLISSLTTPPKDALERNHGYAFATKAISSHNSNKSYFTLGGELYEMAPGNLSNTNGVSGTWSFLSDQVMTQLNRHSQNPTTTPVRDVFTFNELKTVFYNDSPEEAEEPYPYTLGGSLAVPDHGDGWKLMSKAQADALIYFNTSTGMVGTISGAHNTCIHINVSGSKMEDYGILNETFSNTKSPKIYVFGIMFFPNGYYDLTDLISSTYFNQPFSAGSSRSVYPILSYEAFDAMAEAGVIFLPAGGYYSSSWNGMTGYWPTYNLGTSGAASKMHNTKWDKTGTNTVASSGGRTVYRPIRLIRGVTPESDTSVSQGDNWIWD